MGGQRRVAAIAIGLLLATGAGATSTSRPRLYFDAAGLAGLRTLAQQTTPCLYGPIPAEGWQKVLARAKALADAPAYSYTVQIPAANGEHAGWKWSYTLSTAPPPNHDESPHYPPWTAMFQERSDSLTTRLRHFALAYAVTGDERWFQKANEIVTALIAWPQWTDPSYSKGSLTACLDTGHCTQTVGLFYDWCYDKLSDTQRQQIRAALIAKGIEPIRKQLQKLDPYHNFWAVINTGLGVAALAVYGEEPAAEGWVQEAIANTAKQFDRQGKDGGSYEGPMYGTYAADSLAALIFALDSSRTAHSLRQHPFLATLPRFAVNGLSPHVHGLPTFGDGGWGAAYPLTMAMLAVAGDEAARYYLVASGHLARLEDINDFCFFGPLLAAKTAPQPPAWRGADVFQDIGYAFLRGQSDAEPYLAVKCGPPTQDVGHNHLDHNSFQITALGKVVAADPGYRSYFNPPARRYTTSTFGHNSIVLDLDDAYLKSHSVAVGGKDQVQLAGAGFTEFLAAPGISFVTGEAAAAYRRDKFNPLSRFARQIVYLPPNAYLVRDDLVGTGPHTYSWLLHGPADSTIETKGDQALVTQPGALLVAQVFAPGGVAWRSGSFAGAETFGPYAAATTRRREAAMRLSAVLVPRANTELVANPGFENGLAGWTPRNADNQLPNHTVSRDQPHGGQLCGRIEKAGYFYSSPMALRPGTKLTARVWVRTTGATKGAEWVLYSWNAAGVSSRPAIVAAVKSEGAWKEVVLTTTVPPDSTSVRLAFNYFDTGVGYLDDVSVELDQPLRAGAPPTITPLGADAADGLQVTVDGWQHHLAYGSAGQVTSDGKLAIVSRDPAGRTASVLLQDGTKLSFAGQPILTATTRCTVSAQRADGAWQAVVMTALEPHAKPVTAAAVGLTWAP